MQKKVIEDVKVKLAELQKDFPPGINYEINYDVSKFVDASIDKVLHTLLEAFIWLHSWYLSFLGIMPTLIPILAVPVSLIGAFIFMKAFGLSINLITLFSLVLPLSVLLWIMRLLWLKPFTSRCTKKIFQPMQP